MLLTNFKDYLKINVGSANSQKSYYNRVNAFFKVHKEFTKETINEYLAKKLDTIGESMFNGIVTSLRHYSTMKELDIIFPKYKRVTETEKDYLTEDEINNELLSYFRLLFERNAEFYIFTVQFLFYTGIRPDEMVDLKTVDIDFKNNIFICRKPKTKRDKKVPFPNCLIKPIQKHLQKENPNAFKISYRKIYYIFEKVNSCLCYKKKLNPYMLRHSYAKYVLAHGVPVEKLQILMGHKDLKTTMIYARPQEKDALQSYFNNIKPRIK